MINEATPSSLLAYVFAKAGSIFGWFCNRCPTVDTIWKCHVRGNGKPLNTMHCSLEGSTAIIDKLSKYVGLKLHTTENEHSVCTLRWQTFNMAFSQDSNGHCELKEHFKSKL